MVDDLDSGVLLVVEPAGKQVAVDKDIHPGSLEILEIVDLKGLVRCLAAGGRQKGYRKQED